MGGGTIAHPELINAKELKMLMDGFVINRQSNTQSTYWMLAPT
jgi:hypothetical protein